MNTFSQIVHDCKEFAAVPTTLLTLNVISICVLVKGVALTLTATSLLSVISGVALTVLSAATLSQALKNCRTWCGIKDGDRLRLRKPGKTLKLCSLLLKDVLGNNIISRTMKPIFQPLFLPFSP